MLGNLLNRPVSSASEWADPLKIKASGKFSRKVVQ
jgi:hypothetical protein